MNNKKILVKIVIFSVVLISACVEEEGKPAVEESEIKGEKLGIYVTPDVEESEIWPKTYSTALNKAKEGFSTIWILASWKDIEKEEGVYDWSVIDMRINAARDKTFNVGIRTLIITTGNDEKGNFVSELTIPHDVNQNMSSTDFKQRAVTFYRELVTRYKGKVKYIAIGNSVNDYFEQYLEQWEGFKTVYPEIVDAIHTIDSDIIVMNDLNYGESFYSDKGKMQKYLDYFKSSTDDAFGFIFYFIDPVYYGDFENFSKGTLDKILEEMNQRTGDKKVYLIETAMFSKNPNTQEDWTELQSDYVEMLLTTALQKDFILGVSWFTLYDAKDLPFVPWDAKAGLGLFDAKGNPKKAWETWKAYAK
ncbi:MAG: hypothetical protein PVF58_07180 [Candidatus Methanofastidiosia archaeon]|jgi:hypothetical protein